MGVTNERSKYGYPITDAFDELNPAQKEELNRLNRVLDTAMEEYVRDPNTKNRYVYRRATEDVRMFVHKLRSKGVAI